MKICKKQIYVIKHFNTSTIYGLSKKNKCNSYSNSQKYDQEYISIPCFNNKDDAVHVMKSIIKFKNIQKMNPSNNSLCIFNKNEFVDYTSSDNNNLELFVQELDFRNTMDKLLNRNIGICLIEQMSFDDDFVKLNSIEIVPVITENNDNININKNNMISDYLL